MNQLLKGNRKEYIKDLSLEKKNQLEVKVAKSVILLLINGGDASMLWLHREA